MVIGKVRYSIEASLLAKLGKIVILQESVVNELAQIGIQTRRKFLGHLVPCIVNGLARITNEPEPL